MGVLHEESCRGTDSRILDRKRLRPARILRISGFRRGLRKIVGGFVTVAWAIVGSAVKWWVKQIPDTIRFRTHRIARNVLHWQFVGRFLLPRDAFLRFDDWERSSLLSEVFGDLQDETTQDDIHDRKQPDELLFS